MIFWRLPKQLFVEHSLYMFNVFVFSVELYSHFLNVAFYTFCFCRNTAGWVYLRFENVPAAMNAQRAMHLRWFAGRSISAIFMVRISSLDCTT